MVKSFEIPLLLNLRTMTTNFSPCQGSYVLNQFPSIVMSGMKGFHVSASGAIQGHHGPLVSICQHITQFRGSLLEHPAFNHTSALPLSSQINSTSILFLHGKSEDYESFRSFSLKRKALMK